MVAQVSGKGSDNGLTMSPEQAQAMQQDMNAKPYEGGGKVLGALGSLAGLAAGLVATFATGGVAAPAFLPLMIASVAGGTLGGVSTAVGQAQRGDTAGAVLNGTQTLANGAQQTTSLGKQQGWFESKTAQAQTVAQAQTQGVA